MGTDSDGAVDDSGVRCPTCSQLVPRDTEGLIQARVATRIHAERAARRTAKELADLAEVKETMGDSGVAYQG